MRASKGILILLLAAVIAWPQAADAQTPPGAGEIARYDELFSAVVEQDEGRLDQRLKSASNIDRRDAHGRSALHVAAYFRNHDALRKLVAAGADPNALESDYYDIVTIAAVANDLETMKLALSLGCRAGNVTSRYQGTALIALIRAGAPLDHVNNLEWTALIEAIVLGDGGPRHTATLRALVDAGANVNLADGRGNTPLQLARGRSYSKMVEILTAAGAK